MGITTLKAFICKQDRLKAWAEKILTEKARENNKINKNLESRKLI